MANEKRLIDVYALKCQITRYHSSLTPRYISKLVDAEIGDVIDIIDEAPTVDAEPVVHGHWVKYNFLGHEQFACSECQTLGSPQWKRCPVCEAKMDGGY